MAPWFYNPHAGGVKIPERVKQETKQRILSYAAKRCAGKYTRLDIRFKGVFCYIDAYTEPDLRQETWTITGETRDQYVERMRETPIHLCRLRHFDKDRWSVAFYTYSHEAYEPTLFASGKDTGTPEEGFDIGAVYL